MAALVGQFYAERNREYPLRLPVISVGRASDNTLTIQDERVAVQHVRIARVGSRYVLEVTADDAPTALNGTALQSGDRRPLTDGDIISLSNLEFRFCLGLGDGVLSRLCVVAGVHRGKTFRIERSQVMVGRAEHADVQFPDKSVSRRHCLIRRHSTTWWIEDLKSTNGTLVNGIPLFEPRPLADGDEVVVGFSRFTFREHAGLSPTNSSWSHSHHATDDNR